jgi:hypothetical protein
MGDLRHGEDTFTGFRDKAEKTHDLGHSGTCDPLSSRDHGLVSDFAGIELAPPLNGLAEKLDNAWRPSFPKWLGGAPTGQEGIDHPARG